MAAAASHVETHLTIDILKSFLSELGASRNVFAEAPYEVTVL
jgi:hypothetical protein